MTRPIAILLIFMLAGAAEASLDIAVAGRGISFGNSKRFTGLRFNLSDREVEQIRGFNFTFWKPDRNGAMRFDGLGAGLVALTGEELNGLLFGGLVVDAKRMHGAALTLFACSADDLRGLAAAGIALTCDNGRGLAIAGLGMAIDDFTGISIAGLGVGGDHIFGITVGGLGVGGDRLDGIVIAGLGVGSDVIGGMAGAGLAVEGDRLSGLAIAPYTRFDEVRKGICIGLFNTTARLQGVQFGLLNHAANNRPLFRWLPVVNAHF